MSKYVDMTGKQFGRLTVIEEAGRDRGHVMWRCTCRCGNEKIVRRDALSSGKTTSCGCKLEEARRSFNRKCYPRGVDVAPPPRIEDLDDLVKW